MVTSTSRLPVSRELTISQSEISVGPSTPGAQNDRVVINVGGIRHETFLSTLRSIPDTRLFWMVDNKEQSPDYDAEKKEFFFDRHPGLFAYILNFYQTGRLHCPADICGPLFEDELSYWGIDEAVIEPCCWMNYRKHREAQVNLHSFDSVDGDKESLTNTTVDEENPIIDPQVSIDRPEESRHIFRKIRTLWKHWQPKIWTLLEEPNSSRAAQVLGFVSMFLIVTSVTSFCMETLPFFSMKHTLQSRILYYVEALCVSWFTIEFFLRLVFCTDKIKFFKGIMNWFDFCAILPFFLEMSLQANVKTIVVLRVVRLIRVFRIFKLSRHSYGLQILGHTLKSSCRELFLLVFFLSIGVIIFSSLIYYAEKDVYKSRFNSIPEAFWWSVVTMTTIGYGDIVPITWPGKCVGILCALCGVLVIALPIPVIVSNFSLYYSHAQAKLRVTGKTKPKSVFSKASNALRVANSWAFAAQQVQRRHSEASEIGYFCPSNRLTPLQSPSANHRQTPRLPPWEAGTMSNNPSRPPSRGPSRGPSRPHSPKASPFASRASSIRSLRLKSHGQTTIQSGTNSPRKNSLTKANFILPTLQLKSSETRQQFMQLTQFCSNPSINVSPPSTPSKTNSGLQSSVPTPYPQSISGSSLMIDDGCQVKGLSPAVTPDRRQSVPNRLQLPYDFCSSPSTPTSPLYSGLPSSSPSGLSTPHNWSETTSVSSSSRIQSPRGRMGRRNGIFIIGLASKAWQKKSARPSKGKRGKRTSSDDEKSKRQSDSYNQEDESSPCEGVNTAPNGKEQPTSEDEILLGKQASSDNEFDLSKNEERVDLRIPDNYADSLYSPGVSKTLSEVSKRLRNYVTYEKDGDTPRSLEVSISTDHSESSDSRPSSSDLIRNMLSPLVRQKAIFKFDVSQKKDSRKAKERKLERDYGSSVDSSDVEKENGVCYSTCSSEPYGDLSGNTSDESSGVFQLSAIQSTTLYKRRAREKVKDRFRKGLRKSSRSLQTGYDGPPKLVISSPGQEFNHYEENDLSKSLDDFNSTLSPSSDRALSPIQEQSSQSSDNRGSRSLNSSHTGSTLASFEDNTIMPSDGSSWSLSASRDVDNFTTHDMLGERSLHDMLGERSVHDMLSERLSWPYYVNGDSGDNMCKSSESNLPGKQGLSDLYSQQPCSSYLSLSERSQSVQRSKSLPRVQRSMRRSRVPQVRIESCGFTDAKDKMDSPLSDERHNKQKGKGIWTRDIYRRSMSDPENHTLNPIHSSSTLPRICLISSPTLSRKRKDVNAAPYRKTTRHNSWSRLEANLSKDLARGRLVRSRSRSLPNENIFNEANTTTENAGSHENLSRLNWMKRNWCDLHDSGVQSMSLSQTVDHSSSPDLLSPKTPSEKETPPRRLSGNFEYFRNLFKESIHEEQSLSQEDSVFAHVEESKNAAKSSKANELIRTNAANNKNINEATRSKENRRDEFCRSKSLSLEKQRESSKLSPDFLSTVPLETSDKNYVSLKNFPCLTKKGSLDESYKIPSI